MTGANRHARFLQIQQELHPGAPSLELTHATDIRWSSKSQSVNRVLKLYDVILETLSEFAEGSGQTKIEAESLLQQLQTKRFIFLLIAFSKLFNASDFATKSLQSPSLSVADCIHMIEALKETFANFRSNADGDFERILQQTEDVMRENDVQNWDVAGPGARNRKLPSRLADSHVTSTVGRCAPIRSDSDLNSLWNMVLDRQLMELNNRFQHDSYGIMKAAASLMPAPGARFQLDALREACGHYGIEMDTSELNVFQQLVQRKMDGGLRFSSIMEVLDACNKDVFPRINSLLRVLATLPITSCTVERLFSVVNRVKSKIRSTMVTGRLNSISLLMFERQLTEELNSDEIIDALKAKPRRLAL